MIDEIGRQVAAGFELAAECSFVNGEDEIIFDLIMRLLANGMFMEAVDVLTLAFSLAEEDKTEDKQLKLKTQNTHSLFCNHKLVYNIIGEGI